MWNWYPTLNFGHMHTISNESQGKPMTKTRSNTLKNERDQRKWLPTKFSVTAPWQVMAPPDVMITFTFQRLWQVEGAHQMTFFTSLAIRERPSRIHFFFKTLIILSQPWDTNWNLFSKVLVMQVSTHRISQKYLCYSSWLNSKKMIMHFGVKVRMLPQRPWYCCNCCVLYILKLWRDIALPFDKLNIHPFSLRYILFSRKTCNTGLNKMLHIHICTQICC